MFRGWLGEVLTRFAMWLRLDASVYRRVHNVIVPASNGTTQIDHLLVSRFGIFVIETKNMQGWIFGSERDAQWTQVLGRNKYRFQNPLRQNYRHTRCLAEHLHLDESLFHSVVFFIGECRFKTALPDNVLDKGLSAYIRSFRHPVLSGDQIDAVLQALARLKSNPALTSHRHVATLHARFASTTTCPRCTSPLVRRCARKGSNAGREFLGCESYPRCRFTKAVA
jgi:hypothetical protein